MPPARRRQNSSQEAAAGDVHGALLRPGGDPSRPLLPRSVRRPRCPRVLECCPIVRRAAGDPCARAASVVYRSEDACHEEPAANRSHRGKRHHGDQQPAAVPAARHSPGRDAGPGVHPSLHAGSGGLGLGLRRAADRARLLSGGLELCLRRPDDALQTRSCPAVREPAGARRPEPLGLRRASSASTCRDS